MQRITGTFGYVLHFANKLVFASENENFGQ